jgi:hypothetical protein
VVLRAWVTDSLEVNVQLWSTKYWEVESTISPRRGVVAPRTIEQPAGPGCTAQSAGSPGFAVTVTRKLSLDGELKDTQTWDWTYDPTNAYVCIDPADKKKAKKTEDDD